jgi:phage terminase large subunit GpA-like protein
MTYAEKLKDPRWQKKRLEILERDEWKCKLCGDHTTTLHVHHEKYKGEPWDADNELLKTLCEHCHSLITILSGWTIYKVNKSKIDSERYHITIACVDNLGRSMIGSSEYFIECKNFQWFDIVPSSMFSLYKEYIKFLEDKAK